MANSDHVLPLFDDDVFTQAGCNDGVHYAGTPQEYMTSPSYSYPVDMTGAWSPGSFGFSDSDESLNNSPSVGYWYVSYDLLWAYNVIYSLSILSQFIPWSRRARIR